MTEKKDTNDNRKFLEVYREHLKIIGRHGIHERDVVDVFEKKGLIFQVNEQMIVLKVDESAAGMMAEVPTGDGKKTRLQPATFVSDGEYKIRGTLLQKGDRYTAMQPRELKAEQYLPEGRHEPVTLDPRKEARVIRPLSHLEMAGALDDLASGVPQGTMLVVAVEVPNFGREGYAIDLDLDASRKNGRFKDLKPKEKKETVTFFPVSRGPSNARVRELIGFIPTGKKVIIRSETPGIAGLKGPIRVFLTERRRYIEATPIAKVVAPTTEHLAGRIDDADTIRIDGEAFSREKLMKMLRVKPGQPSELLQKAKDERLPQFEPDTYVGELKKSGLFSDTPEHRTRVSRTYKALEQVLDDVLTAAQAREKLKKVALIPHAGEGGSAETEGQEAAEAAEEPPNEAQG